MTYELRRMTSYDIFPLCTIIKKIGIDEVKKIFQSEDILNVISKKGKNVESIGIIGAIDLLAIIIGNIPRCEADLYKFLASMAKTTEKELREISPADFIDLINAVIKHEDFKDFFTHALQLLK